MKESGEPYGKEDYIRSEHSAFCISNLMICSCLIAITSYIDALFLCKKLNFLGERVKKDGNPNFCSEIYSNCAGKSNAQN
jgi:hypothetical protein